MEPSAGAVLHHAADYGVVFAVSTVELLARSECLSSSDWRPVPEVTAGVNDDIAGMKTSSGLQILRRSSVGGTDFHRPLCVSALLKAVTFSAYVGGIIVRAFRC